MNDQTDNHDDELCVEAKITILDTIDDFTLLFKDELNRPGGLMNEVIHITSRHTYHTYHVTLILFLFLVLEETNLINFFFLVLIIFCSRLTVLIVSFFFLFYENNFSTFRICLIISQLRFYSFWICRCCQYFWISWETDLLRTFWSFCSPPYDSSYPTSKRTCLVTMSPYFAIFVRRYYKKKIFF